MKSYQFSVLGDNPIDVEHDEWAGYDLKLSPSADADELPDEGRSLLVIARVQGELCIRIFDADGAKVVDKAENRLAGGDALRALKRSLDPFPDDTCLAQEARREIFKNATSAAGYFPWDRLGYSDFVQPFAQRIHQSRAAAPFTVGVFAPWGQGKSSVMKLLERQLKSLDEKVTTVWFYPWKYHSREEVWRGLVLCLIDAVTTEKSSLLEQLKRRRPALETLAARGLWRYLFSLLPGVKEKWADELVAAVKNEPWSPDHMHRFEKELLLLFGLLEQESGGRPLLVLFVDDLDRCLPEPAAAVLEAMKLVLSRQGLVSVLGIAEEEVQQSLQSIYRKSQGDQGKELRDDWGKDYLRKIIQVPFYLPRPSDTEFEAYVRHCMRGSGVNTALDPLGEWPWARDEIPAEVKRFLLRFISEWDMTTAGRADHAGSPSDLAPRRVHFMLAVDRTDAGFLTHCQDQSGDTFIAYQRWFLDAYANANANANATRPEHLEEAYAANDELIQLFGNSMAEPSGQTLVEPFEEAAQVLPYLRFVGASTAVEKWLPVLRWVCEENLREVKRFLNRFISDWDKALASRPEDGGSLFDLTPERVFFMLAADQVKTGFLAHCQAQSGDVFIAFQRWFLDAHGNADATRPEHLDETYAASDDLIRLFGDCMAEQSGRILVRPFKEPVEVLPYLRFGRQPQADAIPEQSKEEAPAAVAEVEEVAPEPEPEAEPPKKAAVVKKAPARKKKAVSKKSASQKAPSRQEQDLSALLARAREEAAGGRFGPSEKHLQDYLTRVRRRFDPDAYLQGLDALGEWALLADRPERLSEKDWMGFSSAAEKLSSVRERTVARVKMLTARARWRGRLRTRIEALDSEDPEKAETFRAALAPLMEAIAPGAGNHLSTGWPELAWMPIRGEDGLTLGFPAGEKPPPGASGDEKWDRDPVAVAPFLMAAFPVTALQYRAFVEDGGYARDASWWTEPGRKLVLEKEGRRSPHGWDEALDDHPVSGVTWFEAVAFCRWLTQRYREKERLDERRVIRLPTEAEWEWAARGPAGLTWPFGNDPPDAASAETDWPCNSAEIGIGRTSAVDAFAPAESGAAGEAGSDLNPGLSARGLHDLAGNVFEWCLTEQRPYDAQWSPGRWSEVDKASEGGSRVLRGGWFGGELAWCRGAYRDWYVPRTRDGRRGFRCCVARSSDDS